MLSGRRPAPAFFVFAIFLFVAVGCKAKPKRANDEPCQQDHECASQCCCDNFCVSKSCCDGMFNSCDRNRYECGDQQTEKAADERRKEQEERLRRQQAEYEAQESKRQSEWNALPSSEKERLRKKAMEYQYGEAWDRLPEEEKAAIQSSVRAKQEAEWAKGKAKRDQAYNEFQDCMASCDSDDLQVRVAIELCQQNPSACPESREEYQLRQMVGGPSKHALAREGANAMHGDCQRSCKARYGF